MRILALNPGFLPKFSRSQRSPAVTRSGTLYYPIWLSYAAGALEQAGHDVALVDGVARELSPSDCGRLAAELGADLVVIDTSTPSIYADLAAARAIRTERPAAFICLMGPHASALPDETLRHAPWVDAVVRREAEDTLCELALALGGGNRALGAIAGLSFRRGDEVVHNPERAFMRSPDRLPFVSQVYARHLNIRDYFYAIAPYPVVTIVTGRGCPYECTWCNWPQTLHGRGYRYRSVEDVAAEFAWVQSELPFVTSIFVEDDTLTVNRRRCRALAEALIAQGNRLLWTANARADVDLETLRLMRQAGCRLLCVGFESGDQAVLDGMKKRLLLDQARAFAGDARRAGMLVHGCFVVGSKGETRATMGATLEFAKELNPDTVQFYPLMVYPGTEAYQWATENGYLGTNDYRRWLTADGLHNCIVDRPDLPAEELVRFCDRARRAFYLRPRYWWSKLRQIATSAPERERVLKATLTFLRYLGRPTVAQPFR